jgi:uncharacterized protein (TIGR00661 family)
MKILYAIQGTGNGHISRALEIIPHLQAHAEVDILVSGTSYDLKLPFKVKYQLKGLSFVFGKHGGVDVWNTYLKMNSLLLLKEINNLPVEKYDLIISDFEPISSWACSKKDIPCIGLSNQVASLYPYAPKPKHTDLFGKFILQHYAPTTINYGLHFIKYTDTIYTPIIRQIVREATVKKKEHYTVYLPSYDDDQIIKFLKAFKDIKWDVFSKHNKKELRVKNISIQPINNNDFLRSMATSKGVLCNAGFGTTSEALYLQKKLLVIPMKTQYEQHCNAAVLKSMGVPVVKSVKKKHSWLTPYLNAKIIEAKKRSVPTTVMNWEVHPASIYEMIKKYNAYTNIKKIIITENGAAFPDEVINNEIHDIERKNFLQNYLQHILKAKKRRA